MDGIARNTQVLDDLSDGYPRLGHGMLQAAKTFVAQSRNKLERFQIYQVNAESAMARVISTHIRSRRNGISCLK